MSKSSRTLTKTDKDFILKLLQQEVVAKESINKLWDGAVEIAKEDSTSRSERDAMILKLNKLKEKLS